MSLFDFELPGSRRRAINLRVRPGLQLRLPFVVLAITGVFVMLFAAHMDQAYGKLISIGIEQPWLRTLIAEQSHDFLVVSCAIGAGYVTAVLVACLSYGHRMLGPIVPIMRQIEGMKNGDYVSQISLRDGDPFADVARELNELASILRTQEKLAE